MNSDKAFNNLITNLDRDDFNEILFNWNESELNEDGSEILIYADSRSLGPRTGGANIVDKKEFINWLMSEEPFNSDIYGRDIREDKHWTDLIVKSRELIKPKLL
jgi:hypothetical protein